VLIIAGVTLPVSMVFTDTCEILLETIQDEELFYEYAGDNLDPEIQQKAAVCLYGSGRISEEFGLEDKFSIFSDMGSGFDEFLTTVESIPENSVVVGTVIDEAVDLAISNPVAATLNNEAAEALTTINTYVNFEDVNT
jgi:hypothetical protein